MSTEQWKRTVWSQTPLPSLYNFAVAAVCAAGPCLSKFSMLRVLRRFSGQSLPEGSLLVFDLCWHVTASVNVVSENSHMTTLSSSGSSLFNAKA